MTHLRFHGHMFLKLIVVTAVILGLLLTGVLFGLVFHVQSGFTGTASFPVDCAIVFGGEVEADNQPSDVIVRRVSAAADLFHQGKVSQLYLTGGKTAGEAALSEAAVMLNVALLAGVDFDNITIEEQAMNTWENLANTQPLVQQCVTTVAVSDGVHLARIAYLAHKLGWHDLQLHPARPVSPNDTAHVRSTLREAAAILYYGLVK